MQFWTSEMEKQVGVRLQILLRDPQLMAVFDKFGGEAFRRSSVFHGLHQLLVDNDVRGKTCFEVGTWNGLTALVLSRFFDRVITVDIAHNEQKHEILKHAGVTNVRCFDIADNAEKAQIAAKFEFDCAYLDGDHAHDTESDWDITKHCGQVVFHEVWPFQPPVWDLVHSLNPREVAFGGAGLALWRVAK